MWQNEHNFWTFYKRSTASIIGIFFLREHYHSHDLLGLQDWLFSFSVHGSVYFHSSGRGGRRLPRHCVWSSRGLGTPEVKSVPVPAFTGNIAPSNLAEQQLPDRPEPAEIARDRGAWRQPTANTRPPGGVHLTWKTSHHMIASVSGSASMRAVSEETRYFALLFKLFHKKNILSSNCASKKHASGKETSKKSQNSGY